MRRGLFGNRKDDGSLRERGQALVEFGIVAIAFLFLTFGVFDLARLFQSWVTVQHASREAARYAITGLVNCDGASGDRDACIVWTAKHATSGLSRAGDNGSAPDIVVETEAWDYDATAGTWLSTGVPGATGKECDQIEVTVEYKHTFSLPVLNAIAPNGVTVVGRQRMTMEPYSPCEDKDGVS
jgi:Flp pilus assembly protein TadG